jgi:prevent-host-death family protein
MVTMGILWWRNAVYLVRVSRIPSFRILAGREIALQIEFPRGEWSGTMSVAIRKYHGACDMTRISLSEAQNTLSELIHRLTPGEVVTITENDRPLAQIVSYPAIRHRPPRPRPPVTGIPRAGSVPGLVVPEDFKEPLDELRGYME